MLTNDEGLVKGGYRGEEQGPWGLSLSPSPEGEGTASGQIGRAHQITVTLSGSAASLVDGPDHQTLTAPHVPSGEDARQAGGVFAILGFGVRAFITLHAKLCENGLFWTKEAHRQQDQICHPDLFGA